MRSRAALNAKQLVDQSGHWSSRHGLSTRPDSRRAEIQVVRKAKAGTLLLILSRKKSLPDAQSCSSFMYTSLEHCSHPGSAP